jgi:hypothetical protein
MTLLDQQLQILKDVKRGRNLYVLDYSNVDWKKIENPENYKFNFSQNAYRTTKKEKKDE